MNRLQLATLLSWAGEDGIQGRKRLQKIVFFLQHAGCPLNCDYTLHHFGPYSRDVADACDEMVAAGLIVEDGGPQAKTMSYVYTLKPETRQLLKTASEEQLPPFKELGESLIQENLWTLELGSTILYYFRDTADWDSAMTNACRFKKVTPGDNKSVKALAFTKSLVASTQNV